MLWLIRLLVRVTSAFKSKSQAMNYPHMSSAASWYDICLLNSWWGVLDLVIHFENPLFWVYEFYWSRQTPTPRACTAFLLHWQSHWPWFRAASAAQSCPVSPPRYSCAPTRLRIMCIWYALTRVFAHAHRAHILAVYLQMCALHAHTRTYTLCFIGSIHPVSDTMLCLFSPFQQDGPFF